MTTKTARPFNQVRTTIENKYGHALALMARLLPHTAEGSLHAMALRYWLMQAHQATNSLGGLAARQCSDPGYGEREERKTAKLRSWLVASSRELFGERAEWEFAGDPRGGWAKMTIPGTDVVDLMILL